ncbi:MAG: PRC-barrel domain-containing protein [Planctomycetaceae bacterium]
MKRMALILGLTMLPGTMMVGVAEDSPKRISEAKSIEGAVTRANSIAGMAVKSPDRKSLGKVEDVVVDMETGAVRYAAISFGGHSGIRREIVCGAVQGAYIATHEPGSKTPYFEMNVSQEMLEKPKGLISLIGRTLAIPAFQKKTIGISSFWK